MNSQTPKPARRTELSAEARHALAEKLGVERRRILAQLEQDLEAGRDIRDVEPDDLVGHASAEISRDHLFTLSQAERDQLREIEAAEARLAAGGYGTCQECGAPIARARLEAVPWARYCTTHGEEIERERSPEGGDRR